jgi:hypothetical protein
MARLMSPPEFELVLNCARAQPDVESIRGLVHQNLDWQAVFKIAERHGVRPMLRRGLKSACWHIVPNVMQLELERFNRAHVQKNLVFTGEFLKLVDLFRQNYIEVAAFKGPLLADLAYGDMSLREFNDLDILVHKTDLCKAEDILVARGYQAQFPDREYRSAFVGYQGQYAFRHPQTGIWVDLHWQLASKGVAFPIQPEDVWPRLRQVTIGGRIAPTFADDDLALFLAAHGTKEGWRRLIWVVDFAQLLHACADIDWAGVLDRARRSHCSRPLLLAIVLASRLLDAPVPAELIKQARNNSAIRSLAEKAQIRMLRTEQPGELEEFLNSLNTHDRLRHRLWPIVTLLETRTVGDYEAMPLPKSLWGLYYLTRPFRLAGKVFGLISKFPLRVTAPTPMLIC